MTSVSEAMQKTGSDVPQETPDVMVMIGPSGKKQLVLETRSWERVAVTMTGILGNSRPVQ